MALSVVLALGAVSGLRQRYEARQVRRGRRAPATAAVSVLPRKQGGPLARRVGGWRPDRPAATPTRVAGTVWAAPLTAVGFLAAAVSGTRPEWHDELGCWVATGIGGPLGWALRRLGVNASTVGQVVLSRDRRPSPLLLAHEAAHARQAERLGPLLPLLYFWWGARHGYRDNPLERSARLAARAWADGAGRDVR